MKVKNAIPRRRPPDLPASLDSLDPAEIEDGSPLEDARVTGGNFAAAALSLTARRSVIEGASFAQARLRTARLRDVRFIRCDFSNAQMPGLEARRVEFIDCRLLGMKAAGCRMDDVLLERCDARYAQWNGGAAQCSDFIDSHLEEADFRTVNLEHTLWTRSNLSRADLTGAALAGADLRAAEIDGILLNAADLRGAIVSAAQALDLARLLGLVIR